MFPQEERMDLEAQHNLGFHVQLQFTMARTNQGFMKHQDQKPKQKQQSSSAPFCSLVGFSFHGHG